MSDLVGFLLARISEDEEVARTLLEPYAWGYSMFWEASPTELEHIDRWDPARILAECAAKRAIIERETDMGGGYLSDVLFDLVQPYADHPDFDQSWRPDTPR